MNEYAAMRLVTKSTVGYDKPSADWGTIFLVHTCTENGLSVWTSEMTVNDIVPSDSTALLAL